MVVPCGLQIVGEKSQFAPYLSNNSTQSKFVFRTHDPIISQEWSEVTHANMILSIA